jgi:hypothetical protein
VRTLSWETGGMRMPMTLQLTPVSLVRVGGAELHQQTHEGFVRCCVLGVVAIELSL